MANDAIHAAQGARVPQIHSSSGRFVTLRLKPGEDLMVALRAAFTRSGAQAAAIVTAVGSVTHIHLRHANKPEGTDYRGHYEVTALVGTIDPLGEHIHVTLSDGDGHAWGGHLFGASSVYTTLEIVMLLLPGYAYTREPCAASGYDELIATPIEEGNAG